MRRSQALIRKLQLLPHPEGGYYREIHRSRETVVAGQGRRSAVTTIYFLLLKGQRSLLHQVQSDEIWHFYEGDSLRLLRFSPTLADKEVFMLGVLGGKRAPVAVIPRGHWQAAEPTGEYALVGCTVGPGFDFKDFRMMRDDEKTVARFRRKHPADQVLIGL